MCYTARGSYGIGFGMATRAHAILFLVVLMLGTVVLPALVEAADAKRGRGLAEQWCGNCHLVGTANQPAASDAAPTFTSIANRPTTSEEGLTAFLAEPHKEAMKGIVLPRLEIADLAAYIMSLKEP
jgi:mono/diheme cytochrome c family protein